ncbi:MAG: antibiotic biosynthesis monooxygenase [Gammaproteobacteria bacterium]|nr:antibiotic biosynthesis monooxygenase [Gammaproteobacteria bacterium]MBU1733077.1 antibiotic biosynthesis monooxygenase [Gammaproteobacteria bacterium]MBU1892125.1 antibiotic biosynthesis monooxygenase [Gammaproteobacteria bacterium]
MHLALSRFTIASDMTESMRQAFMQRPHHVDHAPGFIRMEVASPVDQPREFWLLTYWESVAHFETWHRSHAFHDSHKGIPKGLKLVPKSTEIRIFEIITE